MSKPFRILPALLAAFALVTTIVLPTTSARAQVLPPGGTFVDDDGSIFEGSIEAIAAAGITTGCNPPENDRFCPEALVTRGEMAAFLVRALDLPASSGTDFFTDDAGSIFEDDINRLAASGITKGCNPPANDQYCPTSSVTRGAMAAFLVRGYGYTDNGGGDLYVDDDTSVFASDIDKLGTAGVTKGCNPPVNDQFCPASTVTRGQMAAFLQRAEGLDPIFPPSGAVVRPFVTGLSNPVQVLSPPGDDRLFVVEQTTGAIRIVKDGALMSTPFLSVANLLSLGGERGLLSMAFHPDYASNGRFFVFYSAPDQPLFCPGGSGSCHTSVIAEYTVSPDPDVASPTGSVILEVDEPYSNHNGGQLAFGPDGYLYVGLGDGGSGNDPHRFSQNVNSLLGKMLRIDIDGAAPYAIPSDNPYVGVTGDDEIWATGLRNPWRFSFDGAELYIGDVGQGAREEIDVVDALATPGYNFGWCAFEGTLTTGLSGCTASGVTPPLVEYSHSEGRSVTGGHVYRGSELPYLDGHYFYGDFSSGRIWSFKLAAGAATQQQDWTNDLGTIPSISAFGVDSSGELYIVSLGGTIYRLEAE